MRCSLVRLSTPTSPSAPGLLLVGAHRLQAVRITSRVGSISPTSSDTKRDFYSALPFDRVGLLSLLRKLSSAFKKSAQETGAQIESAFADLHLDVSFWHEADVPARSNDVCSRGKTGRHMLVESLRAVFGSIHRTCLSPFSTMPGARARAFGYRRSCRNWWGGTCPSSSAVRSTRHSRPRPRPPRSQLYSQSTSIPWHPGWSRASTARAAIPPV